MFACAGLRPLSGSAGAAVFFRSSSGLLLVAAKPIEQRRAPEMELEPMLFVRRQGPTVEKEFRA
jgi:hypothetical protein